MNIDVKINDKVESIEFSNPKGRHQRKFLDVYPDEEKPTKEDLIKLYDFKEKLICDLSNGKITKEIFDELDSEEINKIWNILAKKISGSSDVEKN